VSSSLSLIYDKNINEKVYIFYTKIIKQIVDENSIVIDCGCGSGNLTKYLESISKQVYAFDLDPNMISLASHKTQKTLYKVWDMHDPWPFYGDVVIMSMDVINFTEKPFEVIDHAIESIDNRGSIFIDLYDANVDLNHTEEGNLPIDYHWKIVHHEHLIRHTINTKDDETSVIQYIHETSRIKDYLMDKGFTVQLIDSIDPRKIILICTR